MDVPINETVRPSTSNLVENDRVGLAPVGDVLIDPVPVRGFVIGISRGILFSLPTGIVSDVWCAEVTVFIPWWELISVKTSQTKPFPFTCTQHLHKEAPLTCYILPGRILSTDTDTDDVSWLR